jgi:hypothetical protein
MTDVQRGRYRIPVFLLLCIRDICRIRITDGNEFSHRAYSVNSGLFYALAPSLRPNQGPQL